MLQIYYVRYDALNEQFKLLASTHKPADAQKYYLVPLGDAYISAFKHRHFEGLAAVINELQEKARERGKI